MSDTVVVSTNGDESETEEAVEEVAEAISDAVMDAATISLVERVTRCEDAITVQGAAIEALTEQVSSLSVTDDMQQSEIQSVQEQVIEVAEQQQEVAADTAELVEDVASEVEEASEEITPDELPSVREHWFWKKWRR